MLQQREQRPRQESCTETETTQGNEESIDIHDETPYFGHEAGPVAAGCFRLAGINLDNLPTYADHADNEKLFREIVQYDISVLLKQETGVNWSVIDPKDSWKQRLHQFFEPRSTCCYMSHNRHFVTREAHQWGGTGVTTRGKLRYLAAGAGSDESELGRWTWARFRGKAGVMFRVVSIYQPCKNTRDAGSVYRQHKRWLQENNDDRCPRLASRQDFKKELRKWIQMGD